MQEIISLLIGIVILIWGFVFGDFLAKNTKEELKKNQNLFKGIILISIFGGIISLFFQNDTLMFSFFFIAIVTSRSLKE